MMNGHQATSLTLKDNLTNMIMQQLKLHQYYIIPEYIYLNRGASDQHKAEYNYQSVMKEILNIYSEDVKQNIRKGQNSRKYDVMCKYIIQKSQSTSQVHSKQQKVKQQNIQIKTIISGINTINQVNNMEKNQEKWICRIIKAKIIGIKEISVTTQAFIQMFKNIGDNNLQLNRKIGNLLPRQTFKYQKQWAMNKYKELIPIPICPQKSAINSPNDQNLSSDISSQQPSIVQIKQINQPISIINNKNTYLIKKDNPPINNMIYNNKIRKLKVVEDSQQNDSSNENNSKISQLLQEKRKKNIQQQVLKPFPLDQQQQKFLSHNSANNLQNYHTPSKFKHLTNNFNPHTTHVNQKSPNKFMITKYLTNNKLSKQQNIQDIINTKKASNNKTKKIINQKISGIFSCQQQKEVIIQNKMSFMHKIIGNQQRQEHKDQNQEIRGIKYKSIQNIGKSIEYLQNSLQNLNPNVKTKASSSSPSNERKVQINNQIHNNIATHPNTLTNNHIKNSKPPSNRLSQQTTNHNKQTITKQSTNKNNVIQNNNLIKSITKNNLFINLSKINQTSNIINTQNINKRTTLQNTTLDQYFCNQ